MPPNWDQPGLTWDSPGLFWDSVDNQEPHAQKGRMAHNALPNGEDDLISLAEDCIDGAHQLQDAVGLKQNREPELQDDLDEFVLKKGLWNAADGQRNAKETGVRTARSNARATLTLARDNFKPVFGGKASSAWTAAGWPDDSIAVPSTSDKLLPLLLAVKQYLTDNPAQEVPNKGVTAANTTALHTALSTAVSARNTHKTTLGQCLGHRDQCEKKLRTRLRGLVTELEQLLDPLDPRWLTFGLNRPGAVDAPDAVEDTQATLLGGGKVRVQCARAPRADYYQIYILVVGVDADFHLASSKTDHDVILEGLPVGATVQIKMRAVNEANPGPFGEQISVIIS